jgi:hypothetical protein
VEEERLDRLRVVRVEMLRVDLRPVISMVLTEEEVEEAWLEVEDAEETEETQAEVVEVVERPRLVLEVRAETEETLTYELSALWLRALTWPKFTERKIQHWCLVTLSLSTRL